jgi:hypothetical protein
MTVCCLETSLHVVARGHDLITWRPLSTHATGDRLADPLNAPPSGKEKITTHLEKHIIVGTEEERDRVSPSSGAIGRTMHSTLENVICTILWYLYPYFPDGQSNVLVHLAN